MTYEEFDEIRQEAIRIKEQIDWHEKQLETWKEKLKKHDPLLQYAYDSYSTTIMKQDPVVVLAASMGLTLEQFIELLIDASKRELKDPRNYAKIRR
jgi:hypothetical protein